MTYDDFRNSVRTFLGVHGNRRGAEELIEAHLRAAVQDMQRSVIAYRIGHVTTYQIDDLSRQQMASVGELPAGAFVRQAEYQRVDNPCASVPIWAASFESNRDLLCGYLSLSGCRFRMSIDEYGLLFYLFPPVTDGYQLKMRWDGLKGTFDGADEVPFDLAMADACASYVMAYIEMQTASNQQGYSLWMGDYRTKKRKAYLDHKSRREIQQAERSELADLTRTRATNCLLVNPTTTEIDVMLVGDTGLNAESSVADADAVASLVKQLNPQTVIHLGDAYYSADRTTLEHEFTQLYYGYLPENLYLAFGNHDLDEDMGAGLMSLLTAVAALNGGKRYYKLSLGFVDFFILDGDPRAEDGNTIGSDQYLWFVDAVASSGADWKVAVCHFPFACSDPAHAPGVAALDWDWKAKGIDLVIGAHAHNYERGLGPDNTPWIVNGSGGAALRGYTDPPVAGSQVQYNAKHGGCRLTASAKLLEVTFWTVDMEPIDQLTLRKI